MFKKLKDKIVEEAKNSPQRFQQITQSVSDKLQSSTAEENFFSIDDDVDSRPSLPSTSATTNDAGFTSVSLHSSTPIVESRQRRTSNSSMASDVSFLPRYEPGNMYHLQSDIEASASEMEDNVSTSSTQMGHITKEQVYAELQRVRLRYHKYRGRYTDLANHYKDLERENGKMKSVLVETQDISIRRVGELREQCQLEQKAKAHLENALRVEIDEKQYIIDTLKTKVELLNSSNASETVFEAETGTGGLTNGSPPSPEFTQMSTDLANAKTEISTLNERLQELKASKIISQTKEANLLTRINELEAEMTKYANNSSKLAKLAELESKVAKMAEMEAKLVKMAELEAKVTKVQELKASLNKMKDLECQVAKLADLEAKASKVVELESKNSALAQEIDKLETNRKQTQKSEEEYNLQMARDKMTLHTELQNKDLEINNLKSDLDALKIELEIYEKETVPKTAANNTKMDNLQSQNTKLIDRVEVLTAKCNNMEAELLKMAQLRQENKHLAETTNNLKEVNKGFSKELSELNKFKDSFSDTAEALEVARNDITLLSEEKTNLQQELERIIKANANLNEMFSILNLEHNDLDSKYNNLLIDNTSLSDSLIAKNEELEKVRSDAKSSLLTLETKISKKLQQKFDHKAEKMSKEYEEKVHKLSVNDDNVKQVQVKLLAREDSIKSLQGDLSKIHEQLIVSKQKYDELETNHLELIEENRNNTLENKKLEKVVQTDHSVIEQLQEQLKATFLEVTSLKDRLESSKGTKSTLEERIHELEQILQDTDYHMAESSSKINNDIKECKLTIESLEEAIKLKNDELDRSNGKLKELSQQANDAKDSIQKECDVQIKLLQDELNAVKTDNVTVNSSLTENDKEINLLKRELLLKDSNLIGLNEKVKKLILKLKMYAQESSKLKQEKLHATNQVEKLTEEKVFAQKQLTSIITEIKQEFENVQIENSDFLKQLGELSIIKNKLEEVQLKNDSLLEENQQLSLEIASVTQANTSIQEEMVILRDSLSNSSKDLGEISIIKNKFEEVQLKNESLLEEYEELSLKIASATLEKTSIQEEMVSLRDSLSDSSKQLGELSTIKNKLEEVQLKNHSLLEENQQLSLKIASLTQDNTSIQEEIVSLRDSLSDSSKQLGELSTIKNKLEEVQLKNHTLLEENQQLSLKIASVTQDNTSIQEEMVSLRDSLSDSSIQSEELVRLNAGKLELVKEVSELNKIVDTMTADQKKHIVDLEVAKEEMGQIVEDRNKCLQEISHLKGNLQRLVTERQHLELQTSQLQDVQRQCSVATSELSSEREKTARLNDELSLISVRNRQLAEDRDRLVEENERMIVEVERVKLLVEQEQRQDETARLSNLTSELNSARDQISSLTSQLETSISIASTKNLLLTDASTLNSENILQQKLKELSEITNRFDAVTEENRSVKDELMVVGILKDELEGERKRLQLMVGDLDRSYTEIKHENQLLKDEIQELKISPMNLNSSSKATNNFSLPNGNNNNTSASTENLDLSKEVDQLKEKVQQYKAIDATNRSSIEFYELELDRARARGEKLELKLDETLVTLRHCAELSGVDTQVEYLRHVLYNYMLGREGVVLARVIAAVCKFDPVQTEAVLKHEQQKQTLLGQLGIL